MVVDLSQSLGQSDGRKNLTLAKCSFANGRDLVGLVAVGHRFGNDDRAQLLVVVDRLVLLSHLYGSWASDGVAYFLKSKIVRPKTAAARQGK